MEITLDGSLILCKSFVMCSASQSDKHNEPERTAVNWLELCGLESSSSIEPMGKLTFECLLLNVHFVIPAHVLHTYPVFSAYISQRSLDCGWGARGDRRTDPGQPRGTAQPLHALQ